MNFVLVGHDFEDSIISIIQLYYYNEKFSKLNEISKNGIEFLSVLDNDNALGIVYKNGFEIAKVIININEKSEKEVKRCLKKALFLSIQEIEKIKISWGILTGVRPAKNILELRKLNFSDSEIINILNKDYLVDESKIHLAIEVANYEEKIIRNNHKNKCALYIGIPFCPTICLYCSFSAYPIKQFKNQVDLYLDCLEKEMIFMGEYLQNYEIESIYIGGGTPTSLDEKQFARLLSMINKYFKKPIEYTVEAGRPDTITLQKLKLIKEYGVTRISINPQTIKQETLDLIGRGGTFLEFLNSYEMAKNQGIDNINVDIILGLPNENINDVENTLKKIVELDPANITVHTLAIKRASRLRETLDKYSLNGVSTMENMLQIADNYSRSLNMEPYYMYRQKNMIGNFENIGYCKKNLHCIYNVQIMEEKQSIFAIGAGASSKIYFEKENRLQRIFNVKNVKDYIERIDEMIERKNISIK